MNWPKTNPAYSRSRPTILGFEYGGSPLTSRTGAPEYAARPGIVQYAQLNVWLREPSSALVKMFLVSHHLSATNTTKGPTSSSASCGQARLDPLDPGTIARSEMV